MKSVNEMLTDYLLTNNFSHTQQILSVVKYLSPHPHPKWTRTKLLEWKIHIHQVQETTTGSFYHDTALLNEDKGVKVMKWWSTILLNRSMDGNYSYTSLVSPAHICARVSSTWKISFHKNSFSIISLLEKSF